MGTRDRDRRGRVPDDELAEIARQLRDVLGTADGAPPAPKTPTPSPPGRRHRRADAQTVMLRFAGGFAVPGLILIAIALIGGHTG